MGKNDQLLFYIKSLPSNRTKPVASKAPMPSVTAHLRIINIGKFVANAEEMPKTARHTIPMTNGGWRPYLSLQIPEMYPPIILVIPVLKN